MRRSFDSKFKARVALEAIKEEKTLVDIASQYEVHPNQVSAWKKEALTKMPELFQDGRKKQKSKTPDISRDDIFKEVGVLKVENEFLKKKYRQLYGENAPL
jgi:transposase-like protein